jgi:hypothetical protein
MKKLIISMIAVLLLIGGTVNAQNQQMDPAARIKMQADGIKTALTLTDDQTAKLVVILTAVRKTQDSLRTANPDLAQDRAAMTAKMLPYNDARDAKIKAILTPAQLPVFEAKKAELFTFRRPQAPAAQ